MLGVESWSGGGGGVGGATAQARVVGEWSAAGVLRREGQFGGRIGLSHQWREVDELMLRRLGFIMERDSGGRRL